MTKLLPIIRLQAPAIVVGVWALLWALQVRGNGVVVVALALTSLAHGVHALEHRRRILDRNGDPPERRRRRADDVGWALLVARLRAFWMVTTTVIVILLAISAQRESERVTDALCTFRGDLERRAAQGEQFLEDHPHGIQGITASELRRSLEGQRRTVKSLRSLDCP